MNKISVSHDQHQKLVKMCKAFFPETKNWMDNYVVIHRQTCKICVKEQVLKGIYFNEYEEEDPELHYVTLSNEAKIPWFEFCMIYLIEKLNLKWYNYIRWQLEEGETHIIDYLYEQFKIYEKN